MYDGELAELLSIMRECYSRLMPHEVSLVDLYLFKRSSSVEVFLRKESDELGVIITPLSESFFAMHDAWRGIPRIIICLEKIRTLPKLVKIGGIRHEVAHTVLHGSLEYYLIPIQPSLLEIAEQFNLSSEYTRNLLYLVSIAVKDYEVTRLLYNRGYVEDQVEYIKFLLKASEDDVASWELSKGKPLLEVLCLISSLKTIGCAIPLLNDGRFCQELKQLLVESLSYFPKELSTLVLKFAEEAFPTLGVDTLENINSIIYRCNLIFKTVFNRLC
ncbi:hypothetical protein KEJ48_05915 [Candidatus Bathyarchaeota archaeon]|nr:hypothetical protein [Candidatus Bathyarchaeota archaeon]